MRQLDVRQESWPLREAFSISRGTRTASEVVIAEIRDGELCGRGECFPYAHYGETADAVRELAASQATAIADGMGRTELTRALPPGAARNALDCALWDLEAKQADRPVWELAGLSRPEAVVTVFTLSLDTPDKMHQAAKNNADKPMLKLKLGGPEDLERVAAVRDGAPAARIVVDANEGWTRDSYERLVPQLNALGVVMIEQPFPAAQDDVLNALERPIPVCADESCHDRGSLAAVRGKYDMVNIKLDKTGGLTEALALKQAAQAQGLRIMVGCMIATSLAMAPGILVAQGAEVVDLDGPLLLAEDRPYGLTYDNGTVWPAPSALWG